MKISELLACMIGLYCIVYDIDKKFYESSISNFIYRRDDKNHIYNLIFFIPIIISDLPFPLFPASLLPPLIR